MVGDSRYKGQSKEFWANVRTISQKNGYVSKGQDVVKSHSIEDMQHVMASLGLSDSHIIDSRTGEPTSLGAALEDYFKFRAQILNTSVRDHLMNAAEAQVEFEELREKLRPTTPIVMNKQTKEKKAPAYLTCIANMIIDEYRDGCDCCLSPQKLTTFTYDGAPQRTLARRIDGCFPDITNPIAIWEIKEYYYTTTFGSRIADGVYETLLDGMELEELKQASGREVEHLLIIDARETWWSSGGRPYLCRIIDMLHMGYVDEVLVGREVVDRLPGIVKRWVRTYKGA